MQPDIDVSLVFKLFHANGACSGVSLNQCGFKDLEMNKMLSHIRKCVSAVLGVFTYVYRWTLCVALDPPFFKILKKIFYNKITKITSLHIQNQIKHITNNTNDVAKSCK